MDNDKKNVSFPDMTQKLPTSGKFPISCSKAGFTLIELAIVLIVVGLLVGAGSSMVGTLLKTIKVREAKDNIESAVQSITSWASANNKLPDSSSFPSAAKTAVDSWGRNLIYLYDQNLSPATATKDSICGRRSTPLTLQTTDPAATIRNVAFIITSAGDNAKSECTLNDTTGTPAVSPPTLNGSNFTSGNMIPLNTLGYVTGTVASDTAGSDIIRWVTLDELRSKIGCQGAQLKILNNELPYGNAASPYSATITADGGVPVTGGNYNWCVEFVSTPRPGAAAGFDTVPSGGIKSSCFTLSETGFVQGSTLGLQKKTGFGNFSSGSYQLSVTLRDTAGSDANPCTSTTDNCIQRSFALTINPMN